MSSLPEEREIVAAGYDQVSTRYAALEASDSPWPRMRWLRSLLDRLDAGCDVLDVGCGNGFPATRAIAECHRVTGIDVSLAQIEAAKRNVPDARLIHGDVMSVEFAAASFDAIVAFYVIEHLPREEHRSLFARFARWLRPGGYVLFTIEPKEEPGTVGEWLGTPMFFSQFDAATTIELVAGAGFEILRQATESQREGAHDVAYVWVLARKVDDR